MRDPFLVRSPKEDKFYRIATDLRIANGKGWGAAVNAGSRDIIVTFISAAKWKAE
ncbi:hypothetical protein AB6A23_13920 [Paenibacillus tarimensis]